MEDIKDTDVQINILHDVLDDLRTQHKFQRKLIAVLSGIIVFFIVCASCLSIYAFNRFVKFLEVTDFSSVIEMTTDNASTGTMTLNDKLTQHSSSNP